LCQCCVFSTADPAQQLKAALRVTQHCPLSAAITGHPAAEIGTMVNMIRGGPAVITATSVRKPRSNHLQDKRHLQQTKRAPFCFRHDDRVIKGAPHYLNSYPFPFPLSLSCYKDRERGYCEKDPSRRRKRAPSPPTDQGFDGCALRGLVTAPERSGSEPITDQGSKAGPSEGFDSRPRAHRVRDDPGYVCYMAEARATLPRYPRTFPRLAGTICNGIPPEGGIEPSDPIEWVRVQQITCRYFWSAPLGH
jgi:hypothetical protein